MIKAGFSQKEIALQLGKNKSTISRELKRNSDQRSGEYRPCLAQKKCSNRHSTKLKHVKFDQAMQLQVENYLQQDYSPEQIYGRMKIEGKNTISHERIYQHVWLDKKRGGKLHEHLRRRGRKYRKRGNSKDSRGILKNRIDIDLRPSIVNEKKRLGDLEIDTIIGENHKGALLTINDRVSKMVWIGLLRGKNSKELAIKTIEKLKDYNLIKTITGDNGKEFAEHEQISKELGIDFYFAKPYHSWERGANENTNGLIRQYFKKGSSFENITEEDVLRVQNILNNRPRKKLNYLTPNEFLSIYLKNQKVAFIT